MNPGKIIGRAADDEQPARGGRPAAAVATSARSRFPGRHARGGGPVHEHRRCAARRASGVMCPSYMATRDEEHSTRGRAGALVKALDIARPASGARRSAAARDPGPLPGVQGLQERVPARRGHGLAQDRGPRRLPRAARRAAPVPHVRLGPGAEPAGLRDRAAVEPARRRAARRGCSPSAGWGWRPPGRCPGSSGRTWPGGMPAGPAKPGTQGELVFLADSFTSFTEPPVARAAIELLEAAGLDRAAGGGGLLRPRQPVQGPGRPGPRPGQEPGGPGRPRRGPVVGVEPSCLLTLRDEYPAILPGDPGWRPSPRPPGCPRNCCCGDRRRPPCPGPMAGTRILFHGHCHQKAVTGTAATVALLRAIPGTEVTEVDAGCCGMAGSFGFEAEHYDLSMRIGELRLFPAVRAEPAGHGHRRVRRLLPSADRPRHRPRRPSPAGDRQERADTARRLRPASSANTDSPAVTHGGQATVARGAMRPPWAGRDRGRHRPAGRDRGGCEPGPGWSRWCCCPRAGSASSPPVDRGEVVERAERDQVAKRRRPATGPGHQVMDVATGGGHPAAGEGAVDVPGGHSPAQVQGIVGSASPASSGSGMPSGRLGPPPGWPVSCDPRSQDASPPGPDSTSAASRSMVARSRSRVCGDSGRGLGSLHPGGAGGVAQLCQRDVQVCPVRPAVRSIPLAISRVQASGPIAS